MQLYNFNMITIEQYLWLGEKELTSLSQLVKISSRMISVFTVSFVAPKATFSYQIGFPGFWYKEGDAKRLLKLPFSLPLFSCAYNFLWGFLYMNKILQLRHNLHQGIQPHKTKFPWWHGGSDRTSTCELVWFRFFSVFPQINIVW